MSGSSSSTIVGFSLQNTASTVSGSQYLRFNQQFLEGAVPDGTALGARVGTQAMPAQFEVTSRYADGSVKSAVVTLAAPVLAAGATIAGTIVTLPAAPTPATIAPTAALTGGYDLAVNLDISGIGARRIDAAQELAAAAADGSLEIVREGPLATEVRFDVPVARALRLTFDVVTYADGSTSTKVWFRNDSAMGPTGGSIQYNSISIVEDGQAKFSRGALTQNQFQTWTQEVFDGASAAATLHVRHDVDYLERTGAILSYDLTAATGPAPSIPAGWTNVLGVNGVTTYMPTTGGRADIGPTTGANADWLISQDPAAAKYALAQAQAAGTIPWHYYDAARGHYLSLDDHPRLWIDGRAAVKPSQIASNNGWTTDRAHTPDMSYVAWLLTGDTYHLDMLNAQASWVLAETWNEPRQNGLGIVANESEQVRAQAWSLRTIQEAAYANPDGSFEKAYFTRIADNNWSDLRGRIADLSGDQNDIRGYIPGDYREARAIAPWQQDFFASTSTLAALHGNEDARAVLKWQANFLSGRFLSADLNPYTGYNYSLTVYGSNGSSLDTWAQVAAATRDAGMYSTGPGAGYYAALAAMSNANLITVFSGGEDPTDHKVAADAMRAYGWLLASNSPDLRDELQYQIAPRMADGSQIGQSEMRVVAPTAANNTLTFSGGNAFVYDRGIGRTTLVGTGGADILIDASSGGGDRLSGMGGDDYLIGGTGTNAFAPGPGQDYVLIRGGAARIEVSSALPGRVEIEGFRPGTDFVVLLGQASPAAIVASAIADGYGGTLLRLSADRTIRLNGIAPEQVTTAFFAAAGASPAPQGDTMAGGPYDNAYTVDHVLDRVVELPNGGIDRVTATIDHTLAAHAENLSLVGAARRGSGNDLGNLIYGAAGDDTLTGLDGRDSLYGGAGRDWLDGGPGNDRLVGGLGDNTLIGGAGDDAYVLGSGADRVIEAANSGIDHVHAAVSMTLSANVERLTLIGTIGAFGIGNALDNTISGNGGGNRIDGGSGHDMLAGLNGNDTLLGGIGNDTMIGGIGNDVLDGRAGGDSMLGGAGHDTYSVDSALDIVVEAAGGGLDLVQATRSYVLTAYVEHLTLLGTLGFSGAGNALANTLTGNAGANRLSGAEGNDLLIGGAGNDTLIGGASADSFRLGGPGQGTDVILDFDPAVDLLQLSRAGFDGAFATGAFAPDRFTAGAVAIGSGAQVIYDAPSGLLRFDADGAGGSAAETIARLLGAPAFSAADIIVIA